MARSAVQHQRPSDPQNSASRLSVTSFAPTPAGGFTLTWDTVSGKTYRVERSTTLASGPREIVQNNIPGDGQPKTVTDTTTAPRLFYRVAVIEIGP